LIPLPGHRVWSSSSLAKGLPVKSKPSQAAVWFLVSLLLFPFFAPALGAPTAMAQAAAAAAPVPTPAQLDQLLAPVALYPDSLLAQITTASTNPQEILDFDNWLAANSTLTNQTLADAAQKQGFDPAFLALSAFPRVVSMMAENIDDYAAIGQAFTADQGAVTASIQRLRSQAYKAGNLQTNQQQKVEVQQAAGATTYVIQPANPQVVYVPVYNPTVVYVQPAVPVALPLITFGIGIGIGWLVATSNPWGWGGWGWGWGPRGGVYYNRTVFVGWHGGYRPPNNWYRPRPVPYASRPGYGGNWGYRPRNYNPPGVPSRLPSYNRPGVRPGYRPPTTQPYPRPGTTPGNGRPGGGNPGTPGNGRPGGGTPPGGGNNRPGGGGGTPPSNNRPSTQPTRPPNTSRPSQPQTRPAPASRPAPTQGSRPAPQSRPQGGQQGGQQPR
jgi:hypothetical protein